MTVLASVAAIKTALDLVIVNNVNGDIEADDHNQVITDLIDTLEALLPLTDAEVKSGYENNADTNAFTDSEKTIVGNTSNTNTGDQTDIEDFSGTKAQFNTACDDGTFIYSGDSIPVADITGLDQNAITQEINAQTGTSYTLLDSDHGKLVTLDNASAIALDVDTGLRSDFACVILQKGAGVVTIGGTATVNEFDGFTDTAGQWALVSISHLGSDIFISQGRLA